MSFTYEDKKINSLFIDKIWHTYTTSDGEYTAGLDGNWDIIIFRHKGEVQFTVNGVGKRAVKVPYVAGIDTVGIALKPGVFLRDLKGEAMVVSQHIIPKNDEQSVLLGGKLFVIPDFKTAEKFVEALAEEGILQVNVVAASFAQGGAKRASERSVRRHVSQTTGLSPYFFHQIQRAQQAVRLLQRGTPIAQAAAEAGYADQAHMTKAVKQLMGRTPAEIIALRQQQ